MLQSIPDPFDSYGSHETENNRLFSVLQPLSLSLIPEHSASSISLHSDQTSKMHTPHPTWVPAAAPEDHEDDSEERVRVGKYKDRSGDGDRGEEEEGEQGDVANSSSSTEGSALGAWRSMLMPSTSRLPEPDHSKLPEPGSKGKAEFEGTSTQARAISEEQGREQSPESDTSYTDSSGIKAQSPSGTIRGRPPSSQFAI